MTFAEYRESRGLTLERCALAIGLTETSKGYLSRLETGAVAWPIRLALEVEVWSAGQVLATELLTGADRALLLAAQSRAALEATA
jgi:transcriptional regulator with XRE-family HTH domain